MAGARKSGSPLALVAPLAVIAGVAFVAIKFFKGKKGDEGGEGDAPPEAKDGEGEASSSAATEVTIPAAVSRPSLESDGPGSPHGDFHDATPDLDEESPRVPAGTSASRFASGDNESAKKLANGQPAADEAVAAAEDDHEFAEAETEPAEGGESEGEDDPEEDAKLKELVQRAQGTKEKLDKLVEANIPKS